MKSAKKQSTSTRVHHTQLRATRIRASAVKIGMFICEMDRPWIETSFPLQGFEVKDTADIVEIQKYCDYVHIENSYTPKPGCRPRRRMHIVSVSNQLPDRPRAARTDMPHQPRKPVANSLAMRFLLFSLLLAMPLQASSECHREARDMMDTRVDVVCGRASPLLLAAER
jgi:hypothetical protein